MKAKVDDGLDKLRIRMKTFQVTNQDNLTLCSRVESSNEGAP